MSFLDILIGNDILIIVFLYMVTPVEESIHILNKLNEKIQQSLNSITANSVKYEIDDASVEYLVSIIMDLGLILSVSFLDELNTHFSTKLTEQYGDSGSVTIMKAIKVYKSDINKRYPDLRDFRNHFLAHNMRMDNKRYKNVILDGDIRKYRVPQNLTDYIYLTGCINGIMIIVNFFFPTAYSNAEAHREDAVKKVPLLSPQFNDEMEVQIEFDKLKKSVEKILIDAGLL